MRLLVTGSSKGIGAATAEQLVRRGHRVVGLSRSEGIDVRDAELEAMLDAQPIIDGVITCAGIAAAPAKLVELEDADWYESLDVNLTHHMRVARWFLRQRRPGPIVLIASTAGMRPSPHWFAYATAKAGLINLGLSIAAETAADGYRVYVVAPGRCATGLRRRLAPDEDPASIMQPAEVAKVIGSLIDDLDGVMAGQVIEVARR